MQDPNHIQKDSKLRLYLSVGTVFLSLLPGLWTIALVAGVFTLPAADPVETILQSTGIWTLHFLLFTLALGLFGFVPRMREILFLRKITGIVSFFYATVHLMTYLILDQLLVLELILEDAFLHPRILVGIGAYILLLPSFVISFSFVKQIIEPKIWKGLQRMVSFATALGIIHFGMVQKLDLRIPVFYGSVLVLILFARLFLYLKDKKNPPGVHS